MANESVYAEPQLVTDVSQCRFYHVMDLPGFGQVGPSTGLPVHGWDLRACIDDYLGNFDFEGKRALDVGAASGYLTFEMERRGASVVSYDLACSSQWDTVPMFPRDQPWRLPEASKPSGASVDTGGTPALHRSYWLAHRAMGSTAKAARGSVYDISPELGRFDVVVFGAILLHLHDPFRALQMASRLSSDAIIVTDRCYDLSGPVMRFLPNASDPSQTHTWWQISTECLAQMLGVLGFEVESVGHCTGISIDGSNRQPPHEGRFMVVVGRRPRAS